LTDRQVKDFQTATSTRSSNWPASKKTSTATSSTKVRSYTVSQNSALFYVEYSRIICFL